MPLLPFSDASPPTTNASLLTSGTLADSRLSADVPLIASANSFTAGQTITAAANTSALTATYSVTGANTTPLLNLSGTWNTSGIATGIKLNVTDTASGAGSLLADFQVGSVSKASIDKTGRFYSSYANGYGDGFSVLTGSCLTQYGPVIRADGNVRFSSTNSYTGTSDLFLVRDAANTLALRNGTNAQLFRIYNTYTDASNYERGIFDWSTNANTLTFGTQNAGTGTARRTRIQSAEAVDIVVGGSTRTASFQLSASNTYGTTHLNGQTDFQWYSGTSDPTTTTIPFTQGSSTCAVWKNTTSGIVKLWVNDGGTMKSIALV